jgi:hypothetical protein
MLQPAARRKVISRVKAIVVKHHFNIGNYGSPWCPQFQDWAFNCPKGPGIREKWALIPEDTDVLITHTPPYGVLDYYFQYRLGCPDLMDRVNIVRPQVHVFGHIHNVHGDRLDTSIPDRPIHFFNAASTKIVDTLAGPEYRMGGGVGYAPHVIDLLGSMEPITQVSLTSNSV